MHVLIMSTEFIALTHYQTVRRRGPQNQQLRRQSQTSHTTASNSITVAIVSKATSMHDTMLPYLADLHSEEETVRLLKIPNFRRSVV